MENSFSTVALKSLNYATTNFFQAFSRHAAKNQKKKIEQMSIYRPH
jgi:hypothetical protein